MVTVVIALNLAIALFNFYLAFKLWQFCKVLKLITSALVACENYLHLVFLLAPQFLLRQQTNIYLFRQQYQLWQLQLQKIRQIIVLISWMYRVWRRSRFAF